MKIIIAIENNEFIPAFESILNQLMWTEFATIKVVHVMTPMDKALLWPGDECRLEAEAVVAEMAKRLRLRFAGASVEELVLEGHAAETIVDSAIEWHADLVITGSHGKRGVGRFLLGSTATAVAAHSPCSVLIVRPEGVVFDRISKQNSNSSVAL